LKFNFIKCCYIICICGYQALVFIQSGMFTCPYDTISYPDVLGAGDMDAIGVRARPRCNYHEIQSSDINTILERKMHLLCILESHVGYYQTLAFQEGDGL